MESVSVYTALLGQKKLKERFVEDLKALLKYTSVTSIIPGKLCFIKYSDLQNWSVREMYGKDQLSEADQALVDKVIHMLLHKQTDFESVIRMLYSFRNGIKSGFKVHDPNDNYDWTYKDGNEKLSTHNLPKAHFRFNYGKRYILSDESVKKITEFVDIILQS